MKYKKWILPTVLACLVFIGILAISTSLRISSSEVLAVWGWQDNMCQVWFVDPKREIVSPPLPAEPSCYEYNVAQINNQSRLIYRQTEQGTLLVYEFQPQKGFVVEQAIELNDIEITAMPQWSQDGTIYLSAIVNGKEDIYQLNSQSPALTPLTSYQDSMAYAPILSPDGRYLAYSLKRGVLNHYDCLYESCGFGDDQYLLNLETGQSTLIDFEILEPLPYPSYGNMRWSPNSQFLAFTSGDFEPHYLIVLDVIEWKVVAIIDSGNEHPMTFDGWVSDTLLSYTQNVTYPQLGRTYAIPRQYLYSIETLTDNELNGFPVLDSAGTPFTIRGIDWTSDGQYIAVGVISDEQQALNRGIGVNVADNQGNILYPITSPYKINAEPIWSPSGDWIAFRGSNNWSDTSASIVVTNRQGSAILLEVSGLTEPRYGWITRN
jgi:Tol biopolymer transport system component